MRKYYSSYTGNQIDEAVRAIVENQIQLEDLSPELIAEIKKWIAEGQNTGENVREVEFDLRERFPETGDPRVLYVAIDQDRIYYWSGNTYREIKTGAHDEVIDALQQEINKNKVAIAKNSSDIITLNTLVQANMIRINSIDASIEALTEGLENKASVESVLGLGGRVDELQALVGVRNSGDNRTIFEILYQQQEEINSNQASIEELENRLNNDYYTKEEVMEELEKTVPTSDDIKEMVNDIAENDETFDEAIDNKLDEKLDDYVKFGDEEIILSGGNA